jgi:hypothetical protein
MGDQQFRLLFLASVKHGRNMKRRLLAMFFPYTMENAEVTCAPAGSFGQLISICVVSVGA